MQLAFKLFTLLNMVNNLTFVIIGTLIIFLVGFLLRKIEEVEHNTETAEDSFIDDFNDSFLKLSQGQKVLDFVKVFTPPDCVVLRSLLKSHGIETYVISNHFGELYPTFDVNNFSTSIISIFEKDKDSAKQVLKSYLLTLNKKNYVQKDKLEKGVNIASFVLIGVPPKVSRFYPEILV